MILYLYKGDDVMHKFEYNNPLVYQRADPFCYKHTDGYYYFTGTLPHYDGIEIRKAKTINGLTMANSKVIWKKHTTGIMGAHIWAPELHYIDGVWYIYFAAGEAENIWNIRPFALKCEDADPINGEWVEMGKIDVGHESFSLDMTTFIHRGKQYIIWAQSGFMHNDSSLYIASMKTPTERESEPYLLTVPEYDWERRGIPVNEGASVLIRNGKIFVTYSAANTGSNYCMGLMWCDEDADLLDINSWHKSDVPVFKSSEENSQFGPGHNSFTTDADRDILIYHSRNYKEIEGDPLDDINRHARAKVIEYDDDGFPIFGIPQEDDYTE